jgi:hypothetical protein
MKRRDFLKTAVAAAPVAAIALTVDAPAAERGQRPYKESMAKIAEENKKVNRIFYPEKKIEITEPIQIYYPIKDLKYVNINLETTFNLEQTFDIGQLSLLENMEETGVFTINLDTIYKNNWDYSLELVTLSKNQGWHALQVHENTNVGCQEYQELSKPHRNRTYWGGVKELVLSVMGDKDFDLRMGPHHNKSFKIEMSVDDGDAVATLTATDLQMVRMSYSPITEW